MLEKLTFPRKGDCISGILSPVNSTSASKQQHDVKLSKMLKAFYQMDTS